MTHRGLPCLRPLRERAFLGVFVWIASNLYGGAVSYDILHTTKGLNAVSSSTLCQPEASRQ